MTDIPPILDLINGYARAGLMLPRNEFELSEGIRDFTVVLAQERLLGCAALHFYGPALAEVRSLAVTPEAHGAGAGRTLMNALESEAREFELDALFAFTYVPLFFSKMGYREVERGELPLKAWKDCLRCPKFQACDEIAVLKLLKSGAQILGSRAAEDPLIQIPTFRPV
ncbi:MAG: N-acetyltransferase [Candidatus Solibacter usitatus]|nr:N-acetyltransferase [Candidatus Solibacter usitatus]